MNDKWIRYWEKTRSKGKKRYITIQAIQFAIAGIIYSTFHYFFSRNYDNFIDFILITIIYIFGFFIAGLISGFILWKYFEKKYTKKVLD